MSLRGTIIATCSGCFAQEGAEFVSWVEPLRPPEGWEPWHQPSGVIYCPSCVAQIVADVGVASPRKEQD